MFNRTPKIKLKVHQEIIENINTVNRSKIEIIEARHYDEISRIKQSHKTELNDQEIRLKSEARKDLDNQEIDLTRQFSSKLKAESNRAENIVKEYSRKNDNLASFIQEVENKINQLNIEISHAQIAREQFQQLTASIRTIQAMGTEPARLLKGLETNIGYQQRTPHAIAQRV